MRTARMQSHRISAPTLLAPDLSNRGPIAADERMQSLGNLPERAMFNCFRELRETVSAGLNHLAQIVQRTLPTRASASGIAVDRASLATVRLMMFIPLLRARM